MAKKTEITVLTDSFQREDLNILRDKVNELVEAVNNLA